MSTYQQLVDRVIDATHRPKQADAGSGTAGPLTNYEIPNLVNESYARIVELCNLNPKLTTANLTGAVSSYSLTTLGFTGLTRIRSLTYQTTGSQAYPLRPVTLDQMIQLRQSNPSTMGFLYAYALRGLDGLEVYPAAQTSTDTLTAYYSASPTLMSATTDIPTLIPTEYHYVIELGAIAEAMRTEHVEYAQNYDAQFMRGVGRLQAHITRRISAQPKRLDLPMDALQVPVFGDRSVYFSGMGR